MGHGLNYLEKREEHLECLRILSNMSYKIIMQAASDLMTEYQVINSDDSYFMRKRKTEKNNDLVETLEWLYAKDQSYLFSLKNCCMHINNYLYATEKGLPQLTQHDVRSKLLNDPASFIESTAMVSNPFSEPVDEELSWSSCVGSFQSASVLDDQRCLGSCEGIV